MERIEIDFQRRIKERKTKRIEKALAERKKTNKIAHNF